MVYSLSAKSAEKFTGGAAAPLSHIRHSHPIGLRRMQLDLKRLDVAIGQADGVAIFVAAGEHDIAEQVHATARVGQAERVRQSVGGAHVVDPNIKPVDTQRVFMVLLLVWCFR